MHNKPLAFKKSKSHLLLEQGILLFTYLFIIYLFIFLYDLRIKFKGQVCFINANGKFHGQSHLQFSVSFLDLGASSSMWEICSTKFM